MPQVRGEVTSNMVDLSRLSLIELRTSEDPVLLRSLRLVVGHTECSHTGVLQNQAPNRH